jgi:hypothetical protein
MNTISSPLENDEMPTEIDFSHGVRGKFFQPTLKLNLPVYLDEDVQEFLASIAEKKGLAVSEVANDLLKKDIAIFQAMQGP